MRSPVQLEPLTARAVTSPGAELVPPFDYVIGADDVLAVVFWKEPDISGQVRVRPDGRISLPLLRDVQAAGLTPDQLRQHLEAVAKPFFANVNATVIVHEINSRKVFVTGEVAHPGGFALNGPMTVLQALALAGGLSEFSDAEHIDVLRTDAGRRKPIGVQLQGRPQGQEAGRRAQAGRHHRRSIGGGRAHSIAGRPACCLNCPGAVRTHGGHHPSAGSRVASGRSVTSATSASGCSSLSLALLMTIAAGARVRPHRPDLARRISSASRDPYCPGVRCVRRCDCDRGRGRNRRATSARSPHGGDVHHELPRGPRLVSGTPLVAVRRGPVLHPLGRPEGARGPWWHVLGGLRRPCARSRDSRRHSRACAGVAVGHRRGVSHCRRRARDRSAAGNAARQADEEPLVSDASCARGLWYWRRSRSLR